MKNLDWKEIKETLEKEEKFMEEAYLKYCDTVGAHKDLDSLEEIEYVENIKTRLRSGGFIYKDGRILQVLKNQNRLEYYALDGRYVDETTMSKEYKSEDVKYKTDLVCIGESAITGKDVFARYIDDKLCTDYDDKIVDFREDSRNRRAFVNGLMLPAKDIYEERSSYSRSRYSYSTYLSSSVDKDKIRNYIPSEYEKVEEKIGKSWDDSKVIMHKDNFYIAVGGYTKEHYKVPTFSKDSMRYTVIDGVFYYSILKGEEKKESSKLINSEYSELIENYYVRIHLGEVIFEDKPYSKYPRMFKINNEDVVVMGYNQYPINQKDFEFVLNNLETNNSPYNTVSEVKDTDFVIPYKSLFLIISEEGVVSVYDRMLSLYAGRYATNGLECYSNIRFGRKKSNFYKLDGFIYGEGYGDDCRFSLEDYEENTIKAVETSLLTGKNKNGETELISIYGKKTKLKINLSKDIVYSLSGNEIHVVSFNGDEIDIQVNGLVFKIKDNNLYFDGEKVVDNVIYDRDHMEVIKIIPNSKLEKLSGKLTIPLFGIDKDSFNIHYNQGIAIKYEDDGYLGLFNRVDWKIEGIFSKKDGIKHDGDFDIYTNFVVLKSKKEEGRKSKGNSVKFIISGWTVDSMALSKIYSLNEGLFRKICEEIIKNDNASTKSEFLKLIKKTVDNAFYKCVKDNGINVTRKAFNEYVDDRDFFDVVLNLDNVRDHLSDSEYNTLILALENQINGKVYEDLNLTAFNAQNVRDFINHGVNLEKFNNYDGKVQFVAHSAGSYTLKESLQETLFNQIQNLIGSRKFKQKGVLQVSNIRDLIGIGESFYDEVALDMLSSVEKKDNAYLKMVVREVNKLGQTIYKFLKSYDTEMDYLNREIVVNGVRAVEMPLKKLINMLNRFIFIVEGIQEKLKQIDIDEYIKNEVNKMLVWCIDHIKRDLENVPEDIEDIKNPTLNIRLWNREDVLRNLTQGTRTHCCIALDSFNIGALVRYIFNKNIVLAEICEDDKIVGQAFIYMAVSESKMDYKYENKRHIFMVIDNVEVNNNYSKYATDIGKNLQAFMYDFKNYLSSDKISDVLLGTAYNDIKPPYKFKVDMDIKVLGNEIYRDTSTTFYKFL